MGQDAVTFDPSTVVGLDDKPVPPVTFDSSTAVGLDDKPIPPVTFDSSSVVGLDDKPMGPVNPYANEMDNVPGSIPGMQTPEQAAGPHPEQQPVEKASVLDVLSGMPAPASAANIARDQRTVNAVRQFAHGPESAQDQNAQLQAVQHPTDQQSIENADPILASVPVGAYRTGEGLGTAASGVRAGDWSKAARGGTETLGGVGQMATIPMGVAIGNAPIRMAIGYTEGIAAGAGAKAVAQKLNLTPDEVEFANAAGFFAPMAYHTAIGLELTQEQQGTVNRVRASAFGGRVQAVAATSPDSVGVAGQVGPFKFGWAKPRDTGVNFSSQGPTTGIGEGPEAAAPARGPRPNQPAPGGGSAPQFFLQSADPSGLVTPRLITQIAGLIQGAPVEQRAALAIQAHEQTAQQALAKGSILTPSGKTIQITSPEQAQQIVSGMFASAGLPKPPAPPAPSAVAVQQRAQSQTITEVAASAADINRRASQIVGNAPPPPPPPKPGDPGSMQMPLPAGMDQGLLTQDTVNKTGAAIQALPEKLRPQAILEATGNLAKWLFDSKTVIGPDGKVMNVDSQKAAQTTAVAIINAEVDRQAEVVKAQQEAQQEAQQDAAKERQKSAQQAQEERDEAIQPTKTAKKPTESAQPVEIPDTPATQKAQIALAAAPMNFTSDQLDTLIRRTATVTSPVRKAMVEREIQRRANHQEDHAQAGMMGAPIPNGQSREELQRWADAVVAGKHPFVHVPANVAFKPVGVESLTRTPVKGAGPFSGTYYHPKEIDAADVRKAARDKTNPQGALDALGSKGKKPVELKGEDIERENRAAGQGAIFDTRGTPEGTNSNTRNGPEPSGSRPSGEEIQRHAEHQEWRNQAIAEISEKLPEIDAYISHLLEEEVDPDMPPISAEELETELPKAIAFRDELLKRLRSLESFAKEETEKETDELEKMLTLPPEVATGLAAIVEEQAAEDPTTTLDDVLRDKNTGPILAEALVNDGILTNSADNVNPRNALLTTSARAKVGDALLGELLSPKTVEETPDFLKQKILGAMGSIQAIISAPEGWNLKVPLEAAVENFNRHFNSEEADDPGPVVTALVKKLDEPLPAMRAAFSAFAVAATNHDPSDKPFFDFNLAFGTELTQDQYEKGLKPAEKAAEPEGRLIVKELRTGATTVIPEEPAASVQRPLVKGDKVTYTTNKGKTRSGEVAFTDGRIVRIKDGGSEVTKKVEEVKALESPAPEAQSTHDGRKLRNKMDELADHFRPGNVIYSGYWKEYDKVIAFHPSVAGASWSVDVIHTDAEGNAIPGEQQRSHSTYPDKGDKIVKEGPADESKPEPASDATLIDALQLAFDRGAGPKDYNGLKKIVAEFDKADPDQLRMKEAQEAYEAMLNRVASAIISERPYGHETFDRMVRLYEGQPNLSIRTSTSIGNQAYSTPLPLAFIADKFAGVTWNMTTVYEPTAGNGALLIAANPKMTQANELNPARAQTLKDEGFAVTQNDASTWTPSMRFDAVVANPPFGPLAGPVKVDGYSVVKLDHLIIAKALSAMKDDGKAAVIMAAGDREKPGEITNQVRPFFNWLYAHYNVVSDFELDGDLYSRQGASYPVRMIAIDGRVRSAKVSPVADTIPRLKTWEEVYGKAAEHLGPNLEGQRPGNNVAGGPVRTESTQPGGLSGASTGPDRVSDSGEPSQSPEGTGGDGGPKLQPGVVVHTGGVPTVRVGSATATARPDGDVARSDRLAEGQLTPRTVRRESAKPDGHSANALSPADQIVDESNQFQATYRPHSEKKDVAVMAPKALIAPMQRAMDRVAEEAGDIDQWVTDQLGYPDVETMHQAFMGLQTDAIAAAIYQMQRGKAQIVGDQTGVGKGRVAAAMIRWAELHGHVPVFVTESAPLFSPMYADLQDIGSAQTISPLLFNADASITDPKTGMKIFQNPGAMRPVLDRIRETGELPKGRNAVFLTYSQINTDNRQQLTLERIAPNAIFILDESHNAGGDSNTGNFLSELLTGSKGVVFLSATWAKRPDNLPLYAGKTDISIAIPDRALVASAIQAGGAPLQAVLTSLLAETGQFVRRERSFDGIEIKNMVDEKNKAEHTRIADRVTEVLRGIVKADAMYHNLDFARIQAQAKKAGKSAGSKGLVIQHMEFSALVHNMVKQLLLALKAKTAAEEIIASIQRGEKPVFALENTMGAFLDSYIGGHNLKEGDSLKGLTYSKISDRALMRTRYYNEADPMGNKSRVEVPLDDLSPAVRAAYDEAQVLIDALDVDLPVSPIDYIRNEVEKAGYKIAEITGRDARIDYSGEFPVLGTVPGAERKDRVNTATQFNNGGLDALIINRAGSTGISLHSSEKFRDQRMRHMIIGQPAGDVNIVMQILGRVNRTGQLLLPKYTFLAVALPAEMRPAINLAKKMKSLNANVSSNTRAATSIQAVDLMNKYGDRTIAQYLSDNPEMSRLLGLTPDTNDKGEPGANEGLAMKATGHSALLPVVQQQEFMDSVSEAYTNYIDFLDETGQNDLEPRTYDYEARELHTERMYQGVDPSSPFGQDATYGEYSIKRQGKPFTPEEVMQKIADTFGPAAMQLPPRERDTLAARQLADHMEELYKPYQAGLTASGSLDRAQQMRTRGRQLLNDYRVGTGLRIEINGESYNGVVTNIEGAKKPHGNPYAPSSLQFTIAVNGGLRQTKVPGSQMDALVTANLGRNADVRQLFKDYGTDRQKAKIITGNLLGAFGELKQGTKGRIINFTMEDGTSKLGILMPSKFDIKEDVTGTYAMRVPEGAAKFLEQNGSYLQSSQSEIGVFGPTNSRDEMEIRTKMAKSAAGRFFLDPALLDTVQGGEFASSGGLMKAWVKEGRELDALKAIMGKIALYASPSHIDEARTIDEKAKAELEKPKPLKRASGSVTMSFLGAGALDPYVTKVLQPVVDYAKKAAVATWGEIVKIAGKSGSTGKQVGYDIASILYPPVLASSTARDIMGKAVGEPAFEIFKAAQLLQSVDKMFERMTEPEWIEFVDRIQTQHRQDTETLENAQTMLQAVMERQRAREQWVINLGRKPKAVPITLKDKEGYFPNRYSKPPGDQPLLSEDEEIAKIFPKRPFEGPQTFKRQQRYTLKGAVAEGAVPLGNPVRMVMRRLQEGAKFVAANEAMWNGRQAGLVLYKSQKGKMPPGFVKINDKIAQVWRPIETSEGDVAFIQGGEWVIEQDFGRLLNNFLSTDHIRNMAVGRGFVTLKNVSQACKLGFSVFHYGVQTFWQVTSALHTGLDQLYNQGVRGLDFEPSAAAVRKLAGVVVSPFTLVHGGTQVMKYFKDTQEFLASKNGRRMLETYPDLLELVRLAFVGGFKPGLNEDFTQSAAHTNPAREFAAGRLISGTLTTLPWLARGVAIPLFQHIIPRVKLMQNVQMISQKLWQYSEAIEDGSITPETVARNVVLMNEASFGELNYQNNFWDNTVKTAIQLLIGFPGWKEGTWLTPLRAGREIAAESYADQFYKGIEDEGRKMDWARKYTKRLPQLGLNSGRLLSTAIIATGIATMVGRATTGNWLWNEIQQDREKYGLNVVQAADLEILHPRLHGQVDPTTGKPLRFNLPADLRDYEHFIVAPGSYIYHSLAPWVQGTVDTMRNRNGFDNYVYNPAEPPGKGYEAFKQGLFYNLQETVEPITASNAFQQAGQQDTETKIERTLGVTGGAPPNWDMTRAEAYEKDLIRSHHAPLTPEEEYAREQHSKSSIRTAARSGDNEYLERAFKELSYTDAKQLFNDPAVTASERAVLRPLLEKKRIDSVKAATRAARRK